MSITPFKLQGFNFTLDTDKKLLTGDNDTVLEQIKNRIAQCVRKGAILDDHPVGGIVEINDPYGDEYQFAVCLFAKPEHISPDAQDIGVPSEELVERLYGDLLEHELAELSKEEREAYKELRKYLIR